MNPTLKEIEEAIGHMGKYKKLKRQLDYGWLNMDEFYPRALELYEKYMEKKGFPRGERPAFLPAKQEDWSLNPDIVLGSSCGIQIGLSLDELCCGGLIIVGKSGAGKTTLIIHLAEQFIGFEMEQTYVWFYETSKQIFRHVFTGGNVIVIPGSLLRLNTCREPPGVSSKVYPRLYTNAVADVHGMLEKGWATFQDCMDGLYHQLGIGYGNPRRPTELDIYEKMIETRKQKSKISWEEKEALSRWIIKLAPFKNYMEQFGSDRVLDLPRLIGENVVFELTDFSRSVQSHIISALELWTLVYKQHNPEAARITNIRVIDEAMNLVAEDEIKLSKSFVFKTGLNVGRQYRLAYIIGHQKAKALEELLGLAQAVVIMQQTDFSLPFFYRNMFITRDKNQVNYLKNLQIGHGVVAMPERPLTELTVPFHEVSTYQSNEEIERSMKPIIEEFLVKSPRGKYEPEIVTHTERDLSHERKTEIDVTPEEKKAQVDILRQLARNEFEGIGEVYKKCGLSVEYGTRQRNVLLDMGFIEKPAHVPLGGKPKSVYLVTYEGAKYAGIDWKTVRLPGRGSATSRVYGKIVSDWLRRHGGIPKPEYTLSIPGLRKAVDVADLKPNGSIAYECELQPDLQTVSNLQKNDAVGFAETHIVVGGKKEKERMEGFLRKNLDPRYSKCLRIRTIKEFV